MRVCNDLFDKPVSSLPIAAYDAIAERVGLDVRNLAFQIALLLMKEGFAVRDQELHVTNLWPVNRRVVNLIKDAVG